MKTKWLINFMLLMSLLSLSNGLLLAQNPGCIEGTIYREETKETLSEVNISVFEQLENELSINTVRSSPDGNYMICPRQMGRKYLILYFPEFSTVRKVIEVSDENQSLDFYLMEAGSIKGVISNAAGERLDKAHVDLQYFDKIDFPYLPTVLGGLFDTGKEGLFRIQNIDSHRSVQLEVTHPEYETYITEPVTLEPGQELTLAITLVRK